MKLKKTSIVGALEVPPAPTFPAPHWFRVSSPTCLEPWEAQGAQDRGVCLTQSRCAFFPESHSRRSYLGMKPSEPQAQEVIKSRMKGTRRD